MTTLEAIGFTIAGGSAVLAVTMGLFGIGIARRSTFLAPRATARPPNVIYNPHPRDPCQDRGGPMLGWIPWTLSLDYDTMLHGIPGTGTRKGGLAGSMLKVGLDGIVLLRFHAVCSRIAAMTTFLCLVFVWPIYSSAGCSQGETNATSSTSNAHDSALCASYVYNLTNYEMTTLANVPSLADNIAYSTVDNPDEAWLLTRFYAIVIIFWLMIAYAMYVLLQEWIQILAMRRVYYLEHDVWGERRKELKETLMYDQKQKELKDNKKRKKRFTFDDDRSDGATVHNMYGSSHHNRSSKSPQSGSTMKSPGSPQSAWRRVRQSERHLFDRDPWIPHPEQRDTVPNVALYSLLVGNLPSLPEQAADGIDREATISFSKRQSIDWQLSLTTTFFDHCVPNQPGFSSSVAAVTIIPGAKDLAVAWQKWYAAASKLRRLRFIREQIAERRRYEIEVVEGEDILDCESGDGDLEGGGASHVFAHPPADMEMGVVSPAATSAASSGDDTSHLVYNNRFRNAEYFDQVLGGTAHGEHMTNTTSHAHSQNSDIRAFGPEQDAVYSREFAQSAAPCCPRGCREDKIRRATIDELVDMERRAAMEVHKANLELREARHRATMYDPSHYDEDDDDDEGDGGSQHQREEDSDEDEAMAQTKHHYNRKIHSISRQEQAPPTQPSPPIPETPPPPRNHALHHPFSRTGRAPPGKSTNQRAMETTVAQQCQTQEAPTADPLQSTTMRKGKKPCSSNLSTNPSTATAADPPTTGTKHKRKKSLDALENLAVSNDLTLESTLFQRRDAGIRHADSAVKLPKPDEVKRQMSTIEEDRTAKVRLPVTHVGPNDPHTSNALHLDTTHSNPTAKPPTNDRWHKVEAIVAESVAQSSRLFQSASVANGKWKFPKFRRTLNVRSTINKVVDRSTDITDWAKKETNAAMNDLARESTYAVVTFTSRQAAVAARNCLADGRGAARWETLKDIPIPPLADAAAWDLMVFRNCCRPLTLSINDRQKNYRNYFAMVLLGALYSFYTIPLTAASSLVDPENLDHIFPNLSQWSSQWGVQVTSLVSGFMTAMIWTTFFAVCPVLFKAIANFGSKATSVASAEFKALQYYWWFMVLTAFTGQLLAQMVLNGFNDGLAIGSEFRSVLRAVAFTVPSTISASWLNWIIFRTMITLPLIYLLQVNTFVFDFLGLHCCSRIVRGGGPGGAAPYRIFVDSGVVLMCTLALAPASPLVSPACLVYFLSCQPLLRRNLIFMYRPKFDGGGLRWPFVFDMCISSMGLGSILLAVQMALKQALGPALLASAALVPIFLFSHGCKQKYLRAFNDAALLQTSLLDGWDTMLETTKAEREEFRQFLVDAHKAAYVPICLAGAEDDGVITAEPAVVVHTAAEMINDDTTTTAGDDILTPLIIPSPLDTVSPAVAMGPPSGRAHRRMSQHGATFRRAVNSFGGPVRRGSNSVASEQMHSWNDDDFSIVSPFDRSSRDMSSKYE